MTVIALLQFSPVPAYFCCGWVKSPIMCITDCIMYVSIQKYFRNSPLPDNVCDKCEDILCHEETEKQTSEKSEKVPRTESGKF